MVLVSPTAILNRIPPLGRKPRLTGRSLKHLLVQNLNATPLGRGIGVQHEGDAGRLLDAWPEPQLGRPGPHNLPLLFATGSVKTDVSYLDVPVLVRELPRDVINFLDTSLLPG